MAGNPLVYATGVLIWGMVAARHGWLPPVVATVALGLALIAAVLFTWRSRRKAGIVAILSALCFAGAVRYHLALPRPGGDHILNRDPARIAEIAGMISDARISAQGRHRYHLDLDSVRIGGEWQPSGGRIAVRTGTPENVLRYGDRIRLRAKPETVDPGRNPGQFDYRRYLAGQGIFHQVYWKEPDSLQVTGREGGNRLVRSVILPLRDYFERTIAGYIPGGFSSLVRALILGQKQDLDREALTAFQRVGVVHVLAISGLHVGYIIVFLVSLLAVFRAPFRIRVWLIPLVLLIYAALVEFKAPVVRASMMAGLILMARWYQRRVSVYNVVAAAGIILILADPYQVFSPGFQFSFVAVLSIIWGYERIRKYITLPPRLQHSRAGRVLTPVVQALIVSFMATLGTLPLTWYYYGMIPLYAVIANLLVIPLTGVLVMLSIGLLSVAWISPFLAAGIGGMIDRVARVQDGIVGWFAGWPGAALESASPPVFWILIYYAVVILVLQDNLRRSVRVIILAAGAILSFLILVQPQGPEKLAVTFMDVGQGDGALLDFPDEVSMLIDGGPAGRNWDSGDQTIIPVMKALRSMRLRYLVISHPHGDHIGGGLSLLRRIRIDTLITTHYAYQSRSYLSILDYCRSHGIPVRKVQRGDRLHAGSAYRLYVLHPPPSFTVYQSGSGHECNNSSIVLKLQYGEVGVLFTGDLENDAESILYGYGPLLESEILKVGHHGSATSSGVPFLNLVRPIVAVISVAKRNKFRHPSPVTLDHLRTAGVRVYQTSRHGAVRFEIHPDRVIKRNWR